MLKFVRRRLDKIFLEQIKLLYLEADSGEVMTKKAIMGALTLYLDFINLFIMLLRLFGQRR